VWGIYAYTLLSESEERLLLGVFEGERFETAEDDRVCPEA
jgi:hypothetical protein